MTVTRSPHPPQSAPLPEAPAAGCPRWLRLCGMVPVISLVLLAPGLASRSPAQAYEAPLLLAGLNTFFLCLLPLGLAYVAARSYTATGAAAFLLAGSGLVALGVSSLLAGWVMPLAGGPNPTVTVHNLGSLLAGAAQTAGAFLFLRELHGPFAKRLRLPGPAWWYAGLGVGMGGLAWLAFYGQTPVFFDPVSGPSSLRQFVLIGAISLLVAAAAGFLEIYAAGRTEFAYWYGQGLALIAVGLAYVLLQQAVGDVLGWTGRGAQYLGSVYLVLAFGRGRREGLTPAAGQPAGRLWPYLEQRISQHTAALRAELAAREQAEAALRESELFYRTLFANLNGFAYCRMLFEAGQPVDFIYLMVNQAFETQTGLTNVSGKRVSEVIPGIREADPRLFEIYGRVALSGQPESFEIFLQTMQMWFAISVYSPAPEHFVAVFEVVTERKRIAEALRASDLKHRQLFETMAQGVIYYSPAGQILAANPAAERILGLSLAQLRGQTFQDAQWLLKREEGSPLPAAEHPVTVVLCTGRPVEQFVLQMFNPQRAAWHWLSATAVPVYDPDSRELIQVNATFEDITERRRVEKDLRRAAHIFEHASWGIGTTDREGRALDLVNPAFARMHGYSAEALAGVPIPDLCAPEMRGELLDHIRQANTQGHHSFESLHLRRDGSVFPVSVDLTVVNDAQGDFLYRVAFVQDITARRLSEAARQASEQRLREVLENSLDASYKRDLRTDAYEYLSPAFARLSGYTPDEMAHLPTAAVLALMHPDDLAEMTRVMAASLAGPAGRPCQVNYRFRHKAGQYRWFHDQFIVVHDAAGQPVALIGSVSDITERHQADDSLRAALAEKEVLLKEVHHRVKNNLQVVVSLLGLQADRIQDPTALAVFKDSQERVRSIALIHEKLYQSPDLARINFAEYLRELTQSLVLVFPAGRGARVSVEADSVWLGVDLAIPCGLIVNELVTNALKYAFPNGRAGQVRVAFAAEAGPAGAFAAAPRRFILAVADDGVGLPAGLDPAQTRSLGLKLVQILTRQLGGALTIGQAGGVQFEIRFGERRE